MKEVNLEVTKEELMKEHRSIHDLLTTILNRTQINYKAIKSMRDRAKNHAIETVSPSRYTHRSDCDTAIKRKEKLLKYSTARNCGWEKYGSNAIDETYINNENLRANYNGIFDLLQEMMCRQECLIKVVNEYMDLCPIQASADKASEIAARAYNGISTGLPYRWGNPKVVGKPGNGGKCSIKWKLEKDYHYDYSQKDANGHALKVEYDIVYPKITWFVDEKYIANVKDNQITTCDIAGKKCFTLCAEEELNHELSSQDVRLFKAVVGYTKVPITFDHGYGWGRRTHKTILEQKTAVRSVIYTEERWIAVQDQNGSRIMEATGKDKSWAIRTMKQRMKTSMLKQMGLK